MKQFFAMLSAVAASFLANAQPLVPHTVDFSSGTIWFYEYKPPHFNNTNLFPLIICLHGGGESGDSPAELVTVKQAGIPKLIDHGASMEFNWNGKTEGFVVLAPQAHRDEVGYWPVRYVNEMIEYGISNLRVDPKRIFVVGYSDGGNGVWWYGNTSGTSVRKIAGLVPAAPTIVNGPYCNIADNKVAVWAFHGGGDDEAQTVNAVNTLNNPASCPERQPDSFIPAVDTVYAFGGHDVYTNRVYDTSNTNHYPNVYQWMLSVNRNLDPSNNQPPIPVIKEGPVITMNAPAKLKYFPLLDGSGSTDDDIIMDYLWEQVDGPANLLPNDANTEKIRQYPTVKIQPAAGIEAGAEAGVYHFRLRVKDYLTYLPGHTQFANLTVNVQMPESGHAAPATFAGNNHVLAEDEKIWIVQGKYKLYGSTIRPENAINWRFVSGPVTASVIEVNGAGPYPANSPDARFTNMDVPGDYLFEFSVINNFEETGLDTIRITRVAQGALPVTYNYFNGERTSNMNTLNWATSSETNSSRFDVQRSTDGASFTVIGTVSSRGGANTTAYTFEDKNAPVGTAYYRLSQVDKDGRSALSKTIAIINRQAGIFIEKYPNPVHDNLTVTVQGNTNGALQVMVADMQGKTLLQQQWQKDLPTVRRTINVSNLQKGIYQLVIITGQEKQISSFVKY